MSLSQRIELSRMMEVPDEIMGLVVREISKNPDSTEKLLKERRNEYSGSNWYKDIDRNVKAIFSELVQKNDNQETKRGIISSPNLSLFNQKIKGNEKITPDVIYKGRELNMPEIVFSDHIAGPISIFMDQIKYSEYPETARLLKALEKFDNWKKESLRNIYTILGDKQRCFFEEFDKTRFRVFNQEDLASELGYTASTVSRIMNNRFVEANSIESNQRVMPTKGLLVTQDHFKRFVFTQRLNDLLQREFESGIVNSDCELSAIIPSIARRTVTKYRTDAGIPDMYERRFAYESGQLSEPYQISDW